MPPSGTVDGSSQKRRKVMHGKAGSRLVSRRRSDRALRMWTHPAFKEPFRPLSGMRPEV